MALYDDEYLDSEVGGISIPGIPISPTLFVAVIDLPTLCRVAPDPYRLEKPSKRDSIDPDDQLAAEVRGDIQRDFLGVKRDNVPKFAQYLRETQCGIGSGSSKKDGYCPPISLYSEEHFDARPLSADRGENAKVQLGEPCKFFIPSTQRLIAFDGDTQLAAWHVNRRDHNQALARHRVACIVSHGMPKEWAQQAFHDVNYYGHKVNVTQALASDHNDPMTRLAKKIADLPALRGHVDMKAKSLREKQIDKFVTLTSIYAATKAFIGGHAAAKQKTTYDEAKVAEVTDSCLSWFREITDTYGAHFSQKSRFIIGSQCVLVGLGALGNLVCLKEPGRRATALDSLLSVDWSKGEHWKDIAIVRSSRKGQETYTYPNGHYHWNATFEALSKPESPLYSQIRRRMAIAV